MNREEVIELAARTAFEVNKAYNQGLGDDSLLVWETNRNSYIKGVRGVMDGNGPEQTHESWLKEKSESGWRYGSVKDENRKEHPCFMPYAELPESQKIKDMLFVSTVKGMIAHHKLTE